MNTREHILVHARFQELARQYGAGVTLLGLFGGIIYLTAVILTGVSYWWFAGFFVAIWFSMGIFNIVLASMAKQQILIENLMSIP
jgi:hypothetical protein